jgi:hypothetical protein
MAHTSALWDQVGDVATLNPPEELRNHKPRCRRRRHGKMRRVGKMQTFPAKLRQRRWR